jgi:membrane-bound lytic murein transglycosylase D
MGMMQEILRKNGLPRDLVYVALIESGFNTNAYSRAGAAGPWQFIRGTGARYGLEINGWIDERRHPEKSTWAAAAYLKELYGEFGDWYLAMAAYNAGEGRIRNAVADSGSNDFWVIADSEERYLKAETRDYVPKFIAAAIIAKMPESFGFRSIDYQKPLEYDDATVDTQTDLQVIAECAGVGTDVIADLNPHLVRGTTPPGLKNYTIRLPKGTVQKFEVAYARVPESERVKFVYHKVRRGDTLMRIAKRYGVSKSALISANNINPRHKLKSGTTLVIPRGGLAEAYTASSDSYDNNEDKRVSKKKLIHHRVRKGETISSIAGKYDVSVSQIRSWNHLKKGNVVRAGQTLKIQKTVYTARPSKKSERAESALLDAGSAQYHRVKSGDSLWSISQRYGIPVDDLIAMNGLDSSRKIKAGQKLILSKAEAPVEEKEAEVKAEAQAPADASSQDIVVKKENAAPVNMSSKDMHAHVVESGETLWSISRRYGLSVNELREMNGLEKDARIRPGDKLVVGKSFADPKKTESITIAMAAKEQASPDDISIDSERTSAPRAEKVIASKNYKVKKGDVLAVIAKQHGVSVKDLMEWNNISNPKKVKTGQVLKIESEKKGVVKEKAVRDSGPAPVQTVSPKDDAGETNGIVSEQMASAAAMPPTVVSYRVRSGDTLWDIARRHKVTISQIQSWNNLPDQSIVKPGDVLTIYIQ